MISFLHYFGGLFLGWSLGANDSANVFGTAVSSKMVNHRVAVVLIAIFVIIGALMEGRAGIITLSRDLRDKVDISKAGLAPSELARISDKAIQTAMIISYAAALAVTAMTILKVPVSTSQAVVGAIIGVGFMQNNLNFKGLGKVVICWIGTPLGGIFFSFVFYYLFRYLVRRWKPSIFTYEPVMSLLLILCGCYGAYALGANNVANVTAVFVGNNMLTVPQAALFGGISIAIGALTFARPVMITVGKGIVRLDAFSAFICVLSQAVTVHIYAIVGVPVSTSQAIVGAVLGIGFIRGVHTINLKTLGFVSAGWLSTPFVAAFLSIIFYYIANLYYMPGL